MRSVHFFLLEPYYALVSSDSKNVTCTFAKISAVDLLLMVVSSLEAFDARVALVCVSAEAVFRQSGGHVVVNVPVFTGAL